MGGKCQDTQKKSSTLNRSGGWLGRRVKVFSHSFKERLGVAETLDSRQMRHWLHKFSIQIDLKSSRRQWWLRQTWLGPVRGLAKGILTQRHEE